MSRPVDSAATVTGKDTVFVFCEPQQLSAAEARAFAQVLLEAADDSASVPDQILTTTEHLPAAFRRRS